MDPELPDEPEVEVTYMTLADAAKNVGVKAKKTILRWAQAEGLAEKYGRTTAGGSNIERVVPVQWIVGKMRERGMEAQPQFETVTVLEHATFDAGNRTNLPAVTAGALPPEALVALTELQHAYKQSLFEMKRALDDSRIQNERLEAVVRKGQDEEGRLLTAMRKGNRIGFAALALGLVALTVGIGFSLRLGVSLHRNQAEQGSVLEKRISQGQGAIADELSGLKQQNELLRNREEARTRELADLRDTIHSMQSRMEHRDETMVNLMASKEKQARELTDEVARIQQEKARIAEQLKSILVEQTTQPTQR